MTIVSMPVDNSTLAITSIICAVLLFVFILVAADDEIRKPHIAAIISIIAGGLLYWLGFIPIGIMIVAAFTLVVGIFRALKESANQPKTPIKPTQQSTAQTNAQNVNPTNHSEKIERFNQETNRWEKLETDLDNQDAQLSEIYASHVHKNDKPKLNIADSVDEEVDLFLEAILTNKSVRAIGIFVGVMVAVGIVGLVVSMQDNQDKTQSTYIPSATTPSTTTTAATNNQPLVTAPIEAPVNPALMQQCDSYATAHKRKEHTLTYQEQRDDYNKLYEFCLDEAKKLAQTSSTNVATPPTNIGAANSEVLQTYQMAKKANENSRQYINQTWAELISTLPNDQRKEALKLQRLWVKSKQNLCGTVEKNKSIDNLTQDELEAEIKLLECDSRANSERAVVLSKASQPQDEIAKIIKESSNK